MQSIKVILNEIAPEGLTMTVQDPAVWEEPVAEFGLALRVEVPLTADVFILTQEDGCLVRGHIKGEIILPCNRCSEDARFVVDHAFDDFEAYPEAAGPESSVVPVGTEADEMSDDGVLTLEKGAPVLDVSVLLWEEFSLALPVKPLCASGCKGLCPQCGKNLNEGSCSCPSAEADPRLAALRDLKVKP